MFPPFTPSILAGGLAIGAACAGLLAWGRRLRRLPAAPEWQPMPSAAPSDVEDEMAPWLARLAHFGFRPAALLGCSGAAYTEGFRWLLLHPGEKSFATLDRLAPANGAPLRTELAFFTATREGEIYLTADHRAVTAAPAYWRRLIQRRFRRVETQWHDHLRDLPPVEARNLPSSAQLPAMLRADAAARVQALLASGQYAAGAQDQPLMARWSALPGLILRHLAGFITGGGSSRPTRRDLALTPRESGEPPPAITLEEAVERDLKRFRILAHTRHPGDFLRRWLMAATTIAALTFLFGRDQPLRMALLATAVCVLHEAGHWIAMRLFRFRGLLPVFIPFSGDIDRARKLHASAWQHFIVLLAGPLPGLLGGAAVFAAQLFTAHVPPSWLLDAAGLAVTLNAIHLLPFLPLDGGKIADLLYFRDIPWLRPLFTLSSGLAVLLGALSLKSRTMRQAAFVIFGSLIWDLRTIAVVRGARKIAWAGSLTDEDEALRRAFRSVREEGNTGFVGSYGWHHKIDAMLREVLRRQPGLGLRVFGGGFYAAACLAPIVAIAALLLFPVAPAGDHPHDAEYAAEFHDAFPIEKAAAADPSAVAELRYLCEREAKRVTPATTETKRLATLLAPAVAGPLDRLNWADAGIMLHRGELDSPTVALWLEIASSRMEEAFDGGRDDEALRRAELLLHAVTKLEPCPALETRQLVWDAEARALAVVEQECALGILDVKRLNSLRDRIMVLHREPTPEVDNFLLIQEWLTQRRAESQRLQAAQKPLDVRFWLQLPSRVDNIGQSLRSPAQPPDPAPLAIARFWRESRRVGQLPPAFSTPVSATPAEASLIFDFCERQRDITWRRMAILSAIDLEMRRLKTGAFPPLLRSSVPGGAFLTLVSEGGPHLNLTDARDSFDRQPPDWLQPGSGPDLPPSKPLDHQCPLYGAPRSSGVSLR